MGRPKIADRSAVRATIVTLKLTEAERAQLDALVRQRVAELEEASDERVELSASAFIRWLLDDRARKVSSAKHSAELHAIPRKVRTNKK